jgi:DNA-directed RNA polymerase specialized sigma subunit
VTAEPPPIDSSNRADALHSAYTADPSPENLRATVEKLKPAIGYSLAQMQAADDPYMIARARAIAGKAVKSYNPASGASLPTWVGRQLQQLHRVRRQSQGPVKMPDRAMLDNMSLMRATQSFVDKHDREPDLEELADAAAMPIKRIEAVRRTIRAIPSSSAVGEAESTSPLQARDPLLDEATEYCYKDADKLNRQILEMKTGYGGKYEPMSDKLIALHLGLQPYDLSRRSAKLALLINRTHRDLQTVTGNAE